MADTRIGEAIDAVVTTLAGVAALADPVKVYDGPVVDGEYAKGAVFIGYDGDPDGEFLAVAPAAQAPTGPGRRVKNEDFTINCAVVAWSGDTDVKTLRDSCLALFSAVNAALRADHDQGLPPPAAFNASPGALYQGPGSSGLQVRLLFTITVQVRI